MERMQERKKQIEQIINEMDCPKDFVCYKLGFKNLSKISLIANSKRVKCLEGNRLRCKFALHYGSMTICECPLRYYIAKNFHM